VGHLLRDSVGALVHTVAVFPIAQLLAQQLLACLLILDPPFA
jgi:hypothetical protein